MKILTKKETTYDIVALGEVMLRLDPGEGRIRTSSQFGAYEGGGEYNVARGLRKCFNLRGAIVTAFADNEIGHLIENLMLSSGLDMQYVQWKKYDGIGRSVRNGLNFTERGFGVRGSLGISDRGNTAISQMKVNDIDWDELFSNGVRWFHTGGIFCALSDGTPEVARMAMKSAREHGAVVSYDLNYRPSLWAGIGGMKRAQEVNRDLARYVDVMIGNEEDFTTSLGFHVDNTNEEFTDLDTSGFRKMIEQASEVFPNFKVVATTLRGVNSATKNDWGAVAWSRETGFLESIQRPNLEILDRVGGGDSFASGLIYALLEVGDLQTAIEYGAAHGALAMTTPGDTSMATLEEVRALAQGGNARVIR